MTDLDLNDNLGTGLIALGATDLMADPNNSQRLYAAVAGLASPSIGDYAGVYRSDDAGRTWARINRGLVLPFFSGNIELAAHDAGSTTVLYVGVVDVTAVCRAFFARRPAMTGSITTATV